MLRPIRLADAFGAPGAPSALTRFFDARLNDAAEGFCALTDRLRRRRRVLLEEQADGGFAGASWSCRLDGGALVFSSGEAAAALRAGEVEFRIAPNRCVFRELELPARASEFLQGVVRAQIDRLTPWRADELAFGWSAPVARDVDRIVVTVAAARREPIAALGQVGADSVVVSVAAPDGGAPIVLLSQQAGVSLRLGRWRFALQGALVSALLAVALALAAEWTLGATYARQTEALAAEIGARRMALMRREHAGDNPAAQALDARKRATPAAVVVLEALSRAIPDDAYLTDLRLEGEKVEVAGLAADAAALVKHIEQSPHFSRATFTAPTTRGAGDRESFRIEAQVAPINSAPP